MGTVGRRRELTALEAAVAAGQNVAVLGALGMGKSHLVRQALRRMRVHGLVGTGLRLASDHAYLPLALALGEQPAVGGDTDAVARWCAERLDGRLLVIEQLQWVDRETLAVLMELAPRSPLVVSARDAEPLSPEVDQLLDLCEVIRLGPLEDPAGRLVLQAHSRGRAPLPDHVMATAGGCPLVLRELADGPSPLLDVLGLGSDHAEAGPDQTADWPEPRRPRRASTSRPASTSRRASLSPREQQALEAVRAGSSTRDVAESWGVAPSTVDAHVRSAMRKLGARTRWQAAMVANDDLVLAGSHG